jgi:hypothetical protein
MDFVPLCCGPGSVCWQIPLAAFAIFVMTTELRRRKVALRAARQQIAADRPRSAAGR